MGGPAAAAAAPLSRWAETELAGPGDHQRHLLRAARRKALGDAATLLSASADRPGWVAAWRDASVWQTINHHLVMLDRERSGREAGLTAAVVDSQSAKTTGAGAPRGFDASKKIKGRKRHAMADTDGRALTLQVHQADVQDRDGAVPLPRASRPRCLLVTLALADTAYAAARVSNATSIAIRIVRKVPGQVGFEVHPRRWVVKRCYAWLNRNRPAGKGLQGKHRPRNRILPRRTSHDADQTPARSR